MPGEIGNEEEQLSVGYHEKTTKPDYRNEKEDFGCETSWKDSKPQSKYVLRLLKRVRERQGPEYGDK